MMVMRRRAVGTMMNGNGEETITTMKHHSIDEMGAEEEERKIQPNDSSNIYIYIHRVAVTDSLSHLYIALFLFTT